MTDLPSILRQALNLKDAYLRWVEAGKPLRTPERIEELFEVCQQCPVFMRVGADIGRCKECGCWVKRKGEKFNKLAWPTENCPRGNWSAEIVEEPVGVEDGKHE